MNLSVTQSVPSIGIVASPGFEEWLQEQQISFSFTTYQTNRLFCVGSKPEGGIAAYERLFDKPMGLFAQGDRLYMSTRYQIWQFDNLLRQGEQRQGCDRLYIPKLAHTTGDLNVHDVVVDASGDLLFVNTDFSCLSRLSPNYSFEPIWTPPFISKLVAEDRCHLNGLALREGKPAYMTACSTTDSAAGWREHRVKGGVVIDVQTDAIITTGLSMPHSPRWYQDNLWLLNAGSGEFGRVDAQTGQFIPINFCPGFVRGLAFWQNFAFVGLSKLRSRSFSGLALEEQLTAMNQTAQCGLMVIDLNTGAIVHSLQLEGVVEELFDVVVLPEARHPLIMGFQSEEIERLVTFPGSEGVVVTKPTVKRPSIGGTVPVAGVPRQVWEDTEKHGELGEAVPSTPLSPPLHPPKFQRVFHLNAESLAPYELFTYPSLQQRWKTRPQRGKLLGTSASINGEMIGFAIAELLPDRTAELISLFVAPAHRQQKIATRLLAYLERDLQAEGCVQLWVQYEPTSLTAIALEPVLSKLEWKEPESISDGRQQSLKRFIAEESSSDRNEQPTSLSASLVHPTVSLVMTVYNTEAYLAQALDSLLAQTFSDWELILWDDGSTDRSLAIAKEYAERDSRIRLHIGTHVGQGKSLHQAHQLAHGKYVGWIDADDQLAPTALEETVAFLDSHPDYGMVYTNYIDMDANGTSLGLGYRCQIPYTPNRLLIDLLTFHFRLIRATVFKAVGGVDAELGCAEDYDLCLKLEENTRIHHLERPLYFYRINPQGLSHQKHELQRRCSEWAINQALERRGLAQAYQLVSNPETGEARLQQRQEVPTAAVAQCQFEAGKRFARQGNPDAAVACFSKAIRLQPDYIAAYNQLGNVLQTLGGTERAIAAYQQLLTINPNVAQAHCNLGAIWQTQGKTEEAIAAYQHAISLKPNFVLAYLNLGRLHVNQNAWLEAKSCFQEAIRLEPNTAATCLELSNVLQQLGKIEEAIDSFHAALKLQPDLVEAWYNLGSLWMSSGDMPRAQTCFEHVLTLQPDYPQVRSNLGFVLEIQKEFIRALDYYAQALKQNPSATDTLCQNEHLRLMLCDWNEYEQRMETLQQQLQQQLQDENACPVLPLSINSFPFPIQFHTQTAQQWSRRITQFVQPIKQRCAFTPPSYPAPKLRLGYVSADFREHPMGTLIYQLFQHHNRNTFEIYAYSLIDAQDEFTASVQKGCDVFVSLSHLSSEDAAHRIHADGIHILIDLAGYTAFSRPEILALQPAPIQVQYLGHPDTMGAEFIQYILGDQWLIPSHLREHYTEQVIELPHAFVASPLEISEQPMARADFGLPEDAFVYCCFNRTDKFDPVIFATWMQILHQVPQAVLWLIETTPAVSDTLRRLAQQHGIAPERLHFTPRMPLSQYLAAYQLADLFLDTPVYNAGATAIHALWAGLPLLTCPGEVFVARMGASICAAVGLEDLLICDSLADYEQRAVHLAIHPNELATIRQGLQNHREALPLFQPQQWIAHLESACWELWRRTQGV